MRKILIALLCVDSCTCAFAYEIDTHSRITEAAYFSSTLIATPTQMRLGLRKSRLLAPNPGGVMQFPRLHLGTKYYDPVKTDGPDRYATDYDALNSWVMKEYKAPQPQRRWTFSAFDSRDEPYFPVDWMARGAVREDDTKAIFALKAQYWDGERNAALSLDFGFKELPA